MGLMAELETLAASASARLPAEMRAALERQIAALRVAGAAQAALAAGEPAPDFELPDLCGGGSLSTADLLDRGPLALAFVRGFWCPYCRATLAALDGVAAPIRAAGGTLAAITVEPAARARAGLARLPLGFPLLWDGDARVTALFGLAYTLEESLAALFRAAGAVRDGAVVLPIPAAYAIAPDGVVAWAQVDVDFRRRAEPEALAAAIRDLPRRLAPQPRSFP